MAGRSGPPGLAWRILKYKLVNAVYSGRRFILPEAQNSDIWPSFGALGFAGSGAAAGVTGI